MSDAPSMSLEEEMINFRIVSKQMQRCSKKCERNQKAAIEKLKKAIKKGNSESARIYGQDAIREKNLALNHLRMASRIDACASRIEVAVRMGQVTEGMKGVVRGMDRGLAAMNVDQLSALMDRFEKQFEDIDVKTQYMEGAMNSTTVTTTPSSQVDELISKVADSNNLELGDAFAEAGAIVGSNKMRLPTQQPATTEQQAAPNARDDLETRLANLRM